MNEQEATLADIARLIAEDLPKAEHDYKDLVRVREQNARIDEMRKQYGK